MSISIVTVTYNSSLIINRFLESISNQLDIKNIELIIIDNNSPDQHILKRIIQKHKKKHPDISVTAIYKNDNLGFGVSCNYGALLSNYENVLFLNPDTILTRKSLSILLKDSQKNVADICGGMCIHMDSKDIHRTVFKKPTFQTMIFEFSNLGKILGISGQFYHNQLQIEKDQIVDGVGGAYLLIKKNIFKQLGGFDRNIFMYLEDVDLCVRARRLGMKIVYCPHSVIQHVGGASSSNKYRIVQKAWFESREYYAKKHFSKIQSVILVTLYRVERFLLSIRQLLKDI
ncbi:MAG: glycosyltransferase family 2 protein [bacterium]